VRYHSSPFSMRRTTADSFLLPFLPLPDSSGHALRIAAWALWLAGVSKSAHEMCAAPTLEKQRKIWESKIRPVLLSKFMTKVVFSNPAFLWNALGALLLLSSPFSSRC
jgi:hypothetical protein